MEPADADDHRDRLNYGRRSMQAPVRACSRPTMLARIVVEIRAADIIAVEVEP